MEGPFFSDYDLASFADMVDEASPDTAIISRRTGTTDDGHGGQVDTWATVATVAAKVGSLNPTPTEQTIASQNVGVILMGITVPTGTDVKPDDTVQVGADLFEVVGVAPERSFEVRRRIIVRLAS